MAIRTILAAVSGGEASFGTIDAAFRLARRFDAHVEALHARPDEGEALLLYADGMSAPLSGDLLDRIAADAADAAKAAKTCFEAAIARHAVTIRSSPVTAGRAGGASAHWREEVGYAPDIVADRGRLSDLVILGRSARRDNLHSDTIEDVVLQSGRPVVLVPAMPPVDIGKVIAIGWNGTPEAVRAVAAALPFLEMAAGVHIITVGTEEAECGQDLVEYLGWHGIAATSVAMPPVLGARTGEQLLAAARDVGADLLVMGGWSHAPWRDMLFGGTTHDVVAASLMALLLAH